MLQVLVHTLFQSPPHKVPLNLYFPCSFPRLFCEFGPSVPPPTAFWGPRRHLTPPGSSTVHALRGPRGGLSAGQTELPSLIRKRPAAVLYRWTTPPASALYAIEAPMMSSDGPNSVESHISPWSSSVSLLLTGVPRPSSSAIWRHDETSVRPLNAREQGSWETGYHTATSIKDVSHPGLLVVPDATAIATAAHPIPGHFP